MGYRGPRGPSSDGEERPAEVDYVTEGDTKQQLQGDKALPADSSIAVKQGNQSVERGPQAGKGGILSSREGCILGAELTVRSGRYSQFSPRAL